MRSAISLPSIQEGFPYFDFDESPLPASPPLPIAPPAPREFPQPLELITRTRERSRSSHPYSSTIPYPHRAERVWNPRKSYYSSRDEVSVTAAAIGSNDSHRRDTMKYPLPLPAPHSPAQHNADVQQGHGQVYATAGPSSSSSPSLPSNAPLRLRSRHGDQHQTQQHSMSRYSHRPCTTTPVSALALFSSAAPSQVPASQTETHSFDVLRSDPGMFSLEHIASSKTLHHYGASSSLSLSGTRSSSSSSKHAPSPSGVVAGSMPAFRVALSSSLPVVGGVRGRVGKLTSWKREDH